MQIQPPDVPSSSVSGQTCSGSQLAPIRPNQAHHKSQLLVSFCPWLLLGACGIFSWALEAWTCLDLLVFRLFWDFFSLLFNLVFGPRAWCCCLVEPVILSLVSAQVSSFQPAEPPVPVPLPVPVLPSTTRPALLFCVRTINMVFSAQLKCFLFL